MAAAGQGEAEGIPLPPAAPPLPPAAPPLLQRPIQQPQPPTQSQQPLMQAKRVSRRGSSRQNESSSHSAPGSPKLEVRSGCKPTQAPSPPTQVITELPEAPELRSHHEHLKWATTKQYSGEDIFDNERMYQSVSAISGSTGISTSVSSDVTSAGTTGNSVSTSNLNGSSSNGGLKSNSAAGERAPMTGQAPPQPLVNSSNISKDDSISKAVAAAVAAAGYDSEESEGLEHNQHTSSHRSRQKKFLKNFKQLPAEEVVLQRYSCALVSDILLQGHLYLTENYFAFHSNVFGYVTRLQIPVRSVTKITKEKTAKIIPNAVGVCTEEDKHIFASLLSRDTTFKLMTRLWKRAVRELATDGCILEEDLMLPDTCDAPEVGELDLINDDLSSDSEGVESPLTVPGIPGSDPMEQSYVVKRMNQSNGAVYYQPTSKGSVAGVSSKTGLASKTENIISQNEINGHRRSSVTAHPHSAAGILGHLSKSTILSIFVIVLLIFLFCSSLYLVFRIDSLQRQVESRYPYSKVPGGKNWPPNSHSEESPETIQKVLDSNVEQISSVRKSLEKLSTLIDNEDNTGGSTSASAPSTTQVKQQILKT